MIDAAYRSIVAGYPNPIEVSQADAASICAELFSEPKAAIGAGLRTRQAIVISHLSF